MTRPVRVFMTEDSSVTLNMCVTIATTCIGTHMWLARAGEGVGVFMWACGCVCVGVLLLSLCVSV